MKSIIRKILGPKSKYNMTIPYTYMGKVNIFHGSDIEPLYMHCFADTLCGLVDYLYEYHVQPDEVELYELTNKGERMIDKSLCLNKHNKWLDRPAICHSLKGRYKGHIDENSCSFRDRNRQGGGLL